MRFFVVFFAPVLLTSTFLTGPIFVPTAFDLHAMAQTVQKLEKPKAKSADEAMPGSPDDSSGVKMLPPPKPPKPPFQLADNLDGLFDQLKRTGNAKRARSISDRIWSHWQSSDSKSVDLLTNWARTATSRQQYAAALDLLDQVVVLRPEYAEGWNQRATLHFAMRNYHKSIADIERTLSLEPRHYGALAGLASIQETLGRDQQALVTWYSVLEVYPAMKSAQDAVIRLEEDLAGRSL